MTGTDIQRLRELLRLGVPQFAQLLGVHVATAYRWEMARGNEVRLDPLHAALLVRLQQTVDSRPTQAARGDWGQELLKGVLIGGTLAGLAILLAELVPASPKAGRRPARPTRRKT